MKITSTPQFWPLPGGNVGGERVDISLPRNNTGAFKVIRYTVIGRRECILNIDAQFTIYSRGLKRSARVLTEHQIGLAHSRGTVVDDHTRIIITKR